MLTCKENTSALFHITLWQQKTYDIAFYDMNIAFSDMNHNSYIQSNMTNLTVIMKISDV